MAGTPRKFSAKSVRVKLTHRNLLTTDDYRKDPRFAAGVASRPEASVATIFRSFLTSRHSLVRFEEFHRRAGSCVRNAAWRTGRGTEAAGLICQSDSREGQQCRKVIGARLRSSTRFRV